MTDGNILIMETPNILVKLVSSYRDIQIGGMNFRHEKKENETTTTDEGMVRVAMVIVEPHISHIPRRISKWVHDS